MRLFKLVCTRAITIQQQAHLYETWKKQIEGTDIEGAKLLVIDRMDIIPLDDGPDLDKMADALTILNNTGHVDAANLLLQIMSQCQDRRPDLGMVDVPEAGAPITLDSLEGVEWDTEDGSLKRIGGLAAASSDTATAITDMDDLSDEECTRLHPISKSRVSLTAISHGVETAIDEIRDRHSRDSSEGKKM